MSMIILIGIAIGLIVLIAAMSKKKPHFQNKYEERAYWQHQGEQRARQDYRARRY